MRYRTLGAALLLPLAFLSSCSGDEEPDTPAAGDDATASAPPPADGRGCRAQVEVTGAVTASWAGKAEVIVGSGGPDAIYMAEDDDASLTVYSSGEGFETSATLGVDGAVFSTDQGAAGVDADEKGRSASVDAEARGIADETVRIVATFDC